MIVPLPTSNFPIFFSLPLPKCMDNSSCFMFPWMLEEVAVGLLQILFWLAYQSENMSLSSKYLAAEKKDVAFKWVSFFWLTKELPSPTRVATNCLYLMLSISSACHGRHRHELTTSMMLGNGPCTCNCVGWGRTGINYECCANGVFIFTAPDMLDKQHTHITFIFSSLLEKRF